MVGLVRSKTFGKKITPMLGRLRKTFSPGWSGRVAFSAEAEWRATYVSIKACESIRIASRRTSPSCSLPTNADRSRPQRRPVRRSPGRCVRPVSVHGRRWLARNAAGGEHDRFAIDQHRRDLPVCHHPFGAIAVTPNRTFCSLERGLDGDRVCFPSRRQLGDIRDGRRWAEPKTAHPARCGGSIPALVPGRRTDRIRLAGRRWVGTLGHEFRRDAPETPVLTDRREISARLVSRQQTDCICGCRG